MPLRRKPESPAERKKRLEQQVLKALTKNRELDSGSLAFRWIRLKHRLTSKEVLHLEEFMYGHKQQIRVIDKWMQKCKSEVYDAEREHAVSTRVGPASMFVPEIWSPVREKFFIEIFGEQGKKLVEEYKSKGKPVENKGEGKLVEKDKAKEEVNLPTFEFEFWGTPGNLKMQIVTDIWFYTFIKEKLGRVDNLKPVHKELEGLVGIWSGTGKRVFA